MNKILIDKKIVSDSENVKIVNNVITFLKPDEYIIEYASSGNYELTFKINDDVKLIECSFDNELNLNNKYIITKGETKIVKFYNNLEVNEKMSIDLCSVNSLIDYNFVNICCGQENYEININHKCKKTISNIRNRSLALKNAKLDFVINSVVDNTSNGSKLNQNTRIVTFGECDAKISPNMFINLDDIEAKHGSIIGTFKDDEIFYLMSKGISYEDSLNLLIKGFLLADLDIHEEMKEKIINIINMYWR